MKKTRLGLLFAAGILILVSGCSDKNSKEACVHQVTMDLDSGNYDAVLASSCASDMQKAAAYFGRAGFSATKIINRLTDQGSSSSSTSDLSLYVSNLIPTVSESLLNDLDAAKTYYCKEAVGTLDASNQCINGNSSRYHYFDSYFFISLVDTIQTLSFIKGAIESLTGGSHGISLDCSSSGCVVTCDRNGNGVPDEVDAASCGLLISAGNADCSTISSPTGTVAVGPGNDITPLTLLRSDLATAYSATYRGLIITVAGTGTNISTCPTTTGTFDNFTKLLSSNPTGSTPAWIPATTTAAVCSELTPSGGREWPCPVERKGRPLDLVTSINNSLNSSLTALSTALTGSAGTDVQTAIKDINARACPSGTCTATDIANYLQTIK